MVIQQKQKEAMLFSHNLQKEREEQRHKNIMEELQFMRDNKITMFTRYK